jgi:hypothetical protein
VVLIQFCDRHGLGIGTRHGSWKRDGHDKRVDLWSGRGRVNHSPTNRDCGVRHTALTTLTAVGQTALKATAADRNGHEAQPVVVSSAQAVTAVDRTA